MSITQDQVRISHRQPYSVVESLSAKMCWQETMRLATTCESSQIVSSPHQVPGTAMWRGIVRTTLIC